ncbi:MAG: hypothetical protein I8H68_07605 [Flavobacteriia bacterium]|nr:hypothetical protein [Flavobacteriia bacterium]MBH2024851.1 hypothetical protein [Flavobacteriales bacterium]
MKLACSILFSLMIFLSGSKNLLYIIDYHANRDFYESVCENKNRPEMECHGKCQVSKELQDISPSFSLSNLGFDFQFILAQDVPVLSKQIMLHTPDSKISTPDAPFWQRILLSVPNPPPNFNFS